MPTYEYECKSCGHSFEAFQSMSEDPLKNCPQCGKEVRRLINGGSGIIFKGSGFYVTDKKSGSAASGGAAVGTKSSNKPSSESEGTSSSVPAAKTDAGSAASPPGNTASSAGSAAPAPAKT